jgi:hypothetical protein
MRERAGLRVDQVDQLESAVVCLGTMRSLFDLPLLFHEVPLAPVEVNLVSS